VYDLRAENTGRPSGCYEVFWTKAKELLEEGVGTAVDDRRHSQVVHLSHTLLWCASDTEKWNCVCR